MKKLLILIAISLSLLVPSSAQEYSGKPIGNLSSANLFNRPQPDSLKADVTGESRLPERELTGQNHIVKQVKFTDDWPIAVSQSKKFQGVDPDEYSKFEIYAGYSGATGLESASVENGFNVSGVYNFHRYLGVKGDVSATFMGIDGEFVTFQNPGGFGTVLGQYSGKHALYNVTGGLQIKDNSTSTTLKPFAHIMAGFANHRDTVNQTCPATVQCPPAGADFNFTGTSVIAGGGLDIKLNRHIDVRVFQADINPIFYRTIFPFSNSDENSVYTNFRFGAGIVFKF